MNTGISPNALSLIELQRMPLYPKYRGRLSDFFEVAPETLVDDRGFARGVSE
jgi:hypothetical protein